MNYIQVQNQKIYLKQSYESQEQAFDDLLNRKASEVLQPIPNLSQYKSGLFPHFAVLEVTSVRDASRRVQDQDITESHSLSLVLTDGLSEIRAFEYSHWDFYVSLNSKVLLIPPIEVKSSVFLLSHKNIMLLTG